jgi:hypothetical protein
MLGPDMQTFANQWKLAGQNGPCPRQTVFFFPGGMASRLQRALQPYQEGVGVPPNVGYEEVWFHLVNTLTGDWRRLGMYRDSLGCFRDSDNHIIVANGAVEAVPVDGLRCAPHDELANWCGQNNADFFVFGWDWRRRLDETVTFFLDKFVPFFRQQVMAQGCADPFANFSLVGHSFGGMVVNLIARSGHSILPNMAHAITVATPFYGYPGQLHRWFEGQPELIMAELATIDVKEAADPWGFFGDYTQERKNLRLELLRVISSMPGLYTLHFLDEVTYANPAKAFLGADPEAPLSFSLGGYPSGDATVLTLNADAYNPQANGALVRYPTNTGFDLTELAYARTQFQQLSSAMPAAVTNRFHNIRGVTSSNGVAVAETAAAVRWGWISPEFDPNGPSPITDTLWVPGDGTQPAWTARLTPQHAVTVQADGLDHAFMMNNAAVVAKVGEILCAPPANPPQGGGGAPGGISDKDFRDFLKWLYRHRKRIKWPRFTKDIPPDYFPPKFRKRLPAIMRRLFRDILNGPRTKKKPRGKKRPEKRKGRKPSRRR